MPQTDFTKAFPPLGPRLVQCYPPAGRIHEIREFRGSTIMAADNGVYVQDGDKFVKLSWKPGLTKDPTDWEPER